MLTTKAVRLVQLDGLHLYTSAMYISFITLSVYTVLVCVSEIHTEPRMAH